VKQGAAREEAEPFEQRGGCVIRSNSTKRGDRLCWVSAGGKSPVGRMPRCKEGNVGEFEEMVCLNEVVSLTDSSVNEGGEVKRDKNGEKKSEGKGGDGRVAHCGDHGGGGGGRRTCLRTIRRGRGDVKKTHLIGGSKYIKGGRPWFFQRNPKSQKGVAKTKTQVGGGGGGRQWRCRAIGSRV